MKLEVENVLPVKIGNCFLGESVTWVKIKLRCLVIIETGELKLIRVTLIDGLTKEY